MASLVSLACSTERSLRLEAAEAAVVVVVAAAGAAADEFFSRLPSYIHHPSRHFTALARSTYLVHRGSTDNET